MMDKFIPTNDEIDPVVERVAQRLHANLLAEDGPYSVAQGDFPLLTLDGTFDCRELATWAIEAARESEECRMTVEYSKLNLR